MNKQEQARDALVRSIIMAILALSVCAIIIGIQIYAWFAIGPDASGNFGADVVQDINIEKYISYDGADWSSDDAVEIGEIFAGQVNRKQFFVKLINNDNAVKIDIYFYAPYGDFGREQPYYDGESYYYLGSQLQISNITMKVNDAIIDSTDYAVGTEKYLTPSTPTVPKGQATAVAQEIESIPALMLIQGFTLAKNAEVVVQLDITFVDNDTDQSIYQEEHNFACERRLALKW